MNRPVIRSMADVQRAIDALWSFVNVGPPIARMSVVQSNKNAAVPKTTMLTTTAPLTGGGDLSANRTLAVSDATTSAKGVVKLAADGDASASVAVQGNDTRLQPNYARHFLLMGS